MTRWTASDVPDLGGKTMIVTGANSGLGLESARVLAKRGAEVILACRSSRKGEAAKAEICEMAPQAEVHVMQLDLEDLGSVEAFAEAFERGFDRLDVLMNNAGIMWVPYGLTRDGFERQMGTNHLGHFALTGRLLGALRRTAGARVVTVSSLAHRKGTMTFDDLLFEDGRGYGAMKAYARSKLANLLFAYELQRRFERHGIDCLSVAAHPGASQTNLGQHLEGTLPFRVMGPILRRVVPDARSGALSQLRAAVDPGVRGGEYLGPDGRFEMRGYPVRVQSSEASRSLHDARELWRRSERLTGVTHAFDRA